MRFPATTRHIKLGGILVEVQPLESKQHVTLQCSRSIYRLSVCGLPNDSSIDTINEFSLRQCEDDSSKGVVGFQVSSTMFAARIWCLKDKKIASPSEWSGIEPPFFVYGWCPFHILDLFLLFVTSVSLISDVD